MHSISRFEISVITIVFNDNTDNYFARPLMTDKLKGAEQKFPKELAYPD